MWRWRGIAAQQHSNTVTRSYSSFIYFMSKCIAIGHRIRGYAGRLRLIDQISLLVGIRLLLRRYCSSPSLACLGVFEAFSLCSFCCMSLLSETRSAFGSKQVGWRVVAWGRGCCTLLLGGVTFTSLQISRVEHSVSSTFYLLVRNERSISFHSS